MHLQPFPLTIETLPDFPTFDEEMIPPPEEGGGAFRTASVEEAPRLFPSLEPNIVELAPLDYGLERGEDIWTLVQPIFDIRAQPPLYLHVPSSPLPESALSTRFSATFELPGERPLSLLFAAAAPFHRMASLDQRESSLLETPAVELSFDQIRSAPLSANLVSSESGPLPSFYAAFELPGERPLSLLLTAVPPFAQPAVLNPGENVPLIHPAVELHTDQRLMPPPLVLFSEGFLPLFLSYVRPNLFREVAEAFSFVPALPLPIQLAPTAETVSRLGIFSFSMPERLVRRSFPMRQWIFRFIDPVLPKESSSTIFPAITSDLSTFSEVAKPELKGHLIALQTPSLDEAHYHPILSRFSLLSEDLSFAEIVEIAKQAVTVADFHALQHQPLLKKRYLKELFERFSLILPTLLPRSPSFYRTLSNDACEIDVLTAVSQQLRELKKFIDLPLRDRKWMQRFQEHLSFAKDPEESKAHFLVQIQDRLYCFLDQVRLCEEREAAGIGLYTKKEALERFQKELELLFNHIAEEKKALRMKRVRKGRQFDFAPLEERTPNPPCVVTLTSKQSDFEATQLESLCVVLENVVRPRAHQLNDVIDQLLLMPTPTPEKIEVKLRYFLRLARIYERYQTIPAFKRSMNWIDQGLHMSQEGALPLDRQSPLIAYERRGNLWQTIAAFLKKKEGPIEKGLIRKRVDAGYRDFWNSLSCPEDAQEENNFVRVIQRASQGFFSVDQALLKLDQTLEKDPDGAQALYLRFLYQYEKGNLDISCIFDARLQKVIEKRRHECIETLRLLLVGEIEGRRPRKGTRQRNQNLRIFSLQTPTGPLIFRFDERRIWTNMIGEHPWIFLLTQRGSLPKGLLSLPKGRILSQSIRDEDLQALIQRLADDEQRLKEMEEGLKAFHAFELALLYKSSLKPQETALELSSLKKNLSPSVVDAWMELQLTLIQELRRKSRRDRERDPKSADEGLAKALLYSCHALTHFPTPSKERVDVLIERSRIYQELGLIHAEITDLKEAIALATKVDRAFLYLALHDALARAHHTLSQKAKEEEQRAIVKSGLKRSKRWAKKTAKQSALAVDCDLDTILNELLKKESETVLEFQKELLKQETIQLLETQEKACFSQEGDQVPPLWNVFCSDLFKTISYKSFFETLLTFLFPSERISSSRLVTLARMANVQLKDFKELDAIKLSVPDGLQAYLAEERAKEDLLITELEKAKEQTNKAKAFVELKQRLNERLRQGEVIHPKREKRRTVETCADYLITEGISIDRLQGYLVEILGEALPDRLDLQLEPRDQIEELIEIFERMLDREIPVPQLRGETLICTGHLLFLSELKEVVNERLTQCNRAQKQITDIHFIGVHLYIDTDLEFPGINLALGGESIEFMHTDKRRCIDLSGKKGDDAPLVSSGPPPKASATHNGAPGAHGADGEGGEHGGDLTIDGLLIGFDPDHIERIDLSGAGGGSGTRGQDGGEGGDGIQGENARTSIRNGDPADTDWGHIDIRHGHKGQSSGDGGKGGDTGLGGQEGLGGQIKVVERGETAQETKVNVFSDPVKALISQKNGATGADPGPGRGGKAGNGACDGMDYAIIKGGLFDKQHKFFGLKLQCVNHGKNREKDSYRDGMTREESIRNNRGRDRDQERGREAAEQQRQRKKSEKRGIHQRAFDQHLTSHLHTESTGARAFAFEEVTSRLALAESTEEIAQEELELKQQKIRSLETLHKSTMLLLQESKIEEEVQAEHSRLAAFQPMALRKRNRHQEIGKILSSKEQKSRFPFCSLSPIEHLQRAPNDPPFEAHPIELALYEVDLTRGESLSNYAALIEALIAEQDVGRFDLIKRQTLINALAKTWEALSCSHMLQGFEALKEMVEKFREPILLSSIEKKEWELNVFKELVKKEKAFIVNSYEQAIEEETFVLSLINFFYHDRLAHSFLKEKPSVEQARKRRWIKERLYQRILRVAALLQDFRAKISPETPYRVSEERIQNSLAFGEALFEELCSVPVAQNTEFLKTKRRESQQRLKSLKTEQEWILEELGFFCEQKMETEKEKKILEDKQWNSLIEDEEYEYSNALLKEKRVLPSEQNISSLRELYPICFQYWVAHCPKKETLAADIPAEEEEALETLDTEGLSAPLWLQKRREEIELAKLYPAEEVPVYFRYLDRIYRIVPYREGLSALWLKMIDYHEDVDMSCSVLDRLFEDSIEAFGHLRGVYNEVRETPFGEALFAYLDKRYLLVVEQEIRPLLFDAREPEKEELSLLKSLLFRVQKLYDLHPLLLIERDPFSTLSELCRERQACFQLLANPARIADLSPHVCRFLGKQLSDKKLLKEMERLKETSSLLTQVSGKELYLKLLERMNQGAFSYCNRARKKKNICQLLAYGNLVQKRSALFYLATASLKRGEMQALLDVLRKEPVLSEEESFLQSLLIEKEAGRRLAIEAQWSHLFEKGRYQDQLLLQMDQKEDHPITFELHKLHAESRVVSADEEEELVQEMMALFSSMGCYQAKEELKRINRNLFLKLTTIPGNDLPFLAYNASLQSEFAKNEPDLPELVRQFLAVISVKTISEEMLIPILMACRHFPLSSTVKLQLYQRIERLQPQQERLEKVRQVLLEEIRLLLIEDLHRKGAALYGTEEKSKKAIEPQKHEFLQYLKEILKNDQVLFRERHLAKVELFMSTLDFHFSEKEDPEEQDLDGQQRIDIYKKAKIILTNALEAEEINQGLNIFQKELQKVLNHGNELDRQYLDALITRLEARDAQAERELKTFHWREVLPYESSNPQEACLLNLITGRNLSERQKLLFKQKFDSSMIREEIYEQQEAITKKEGLRKAGFTNWIKEIKQGLIKGELFFGTLRKLFPTEEKIAERFFRVGNTLSLEEETGALLSSCKKITPKEKETRKALSLLLAQVRVSTDETLLEKIDFLEERILELGGTFKEIRGEALLGKPEEGLKKEIETLLKSSEEFSLKRAAALEAMTVLLEKANAQLKKDPQSFSAHMMKPLESWVGQLQKRKEKIFKSQVHRLIKTSEEIHLTDEATVQGISLILKRIRSHFESPAQKELLENLSTQELLQKVEFLDTEGLSAPLWLQKRREEIQIGKLYPAEEVPVYLRYLNRIYRIVPYREGLSALWLKMIEYHEDVDMSCSVLDRLFEDSIEAFGHLRGVYNEVRETPFGEALFAYLDIRSHFESPAQKELLENLSTQELLQKVDAIEEKIILLRDRQEKLIQSKITSFLEVVPEKGGDHTAHQQRIKNLQAALQKTLTIIGKESFLSLIDKWTDWSQLAKRKVDPKLLVDFLKIVPEMQNLSVVLEVIDHNVPQMWPLALLRHGCLEALQPLLVDWMIRLPNLSLDGLPIDQKDVKIRDILIEKETEAQEFSTRFKKKVEELIESTCFRRVDRGEILFLLMRHLKMIQQKQISISLSHWLKIIEELFLSKETMELIAPEFLQAESSLLENLFSPSFEIFRSTVTLCWMKGQLKDFPPPTKELSDQLFDALLAIQTIKKEETLKSCIKALRGAPISPAVVRCVIRFSEGAFELDAHTLHLLSNRVSDAKWYEKIEAYTKEKRGRPRDLKSLVQLMADEKEGINHSIASVMEGDEPLLVQIIETIQKEYKAVASWTEADIQAWAIASRGAAFLQDEKAILKAIAILSRGTELIEGHTLRSTQMIAIYLMLRQSKKERGRVCQMFTGEGKTDTFVGVAILLGLGDIYSDFVTTSFVLGARDAEAKKKMYALFGLLVSSNCSPESEQNEELRKACYYDSEKKRPIDVIYGTVDSFERDLLLTEFHGKEIIHTDRAKHRRAVLIDEVDGLFLDNASMVLYLSHSVDTLRFFERILAHVWSFVNQGNVRYSDDVLRQISTAIEDKINSKELLLPSYEVEEATYMEMKALVRRKLPIWIRSAFHAKTLEKDNEYIITDEIVGSKKKKSIIVMDKGTGVEQFSLRWSNGLYQFLLFKHGLEVVPESLKAVFLSNYFFFKGYGSLLFGLSGTLGSDAEQRYLEELYGIDLCKIPRYKGERYNQLPPIIKAEPQEWIDAIGQSLDRNIRQLKRAVLIICDSVQEVQGLAARFKNDYPLLQTYTSSLQEIAFLSADNQVPVAPGDLLIATNLAGRGTDLKTHPLLELHGGLHVILSYLPSNIRIQEQAFGRTARSGNEGSGQFILFDPYRRPLTALIQERDQAEKERLERTSSKEVKKIAFEQDLLRGFYDQGEWISGFETLLQKIRNELVGHDDFYREAQLNSLKNRWAFWMDHMEEKISLVHFIGKKMVIESFKVFKAGVERDFQKDSFIRLIKEPAELIKLGGEYRERERWSQAKQCYEVASRDPHYRYACYYEAACDLLQHPSSSLDAKNRFKTKVKMAAEAIKPEINQLQTCVQNVVPLAEARRIQQGEADYGSPYKARTQERVQIWSIFLGAIDEAIGGSLPKEAFSKSSFLDEAGADHMMGVVGHHGYKETRLSKRLKVDLAQKKIFGWDRVHNQDKEILLPQVFLPLLGWLKDRRDRQRNIKHGEFVEACQDLYHQGTVKNLLVRAGCRLEGVHRFATLPKDFKWPDGIKADTELVLCELVGNSSYEMQAGPCEKLKEIFVTKGRENRLLKKKEDEGEINFERLFNHLKDNKIIVEETKFDLKPLFHNLEERSQNFERLRQRQENVYRFALLPSGYQWPDWIGEKRIPYVATLIDDCRHEIKVDTFEKIKEIFSAKGAEMNARLRAENEEVINLDQLLVYVQEERLLVEETQFDRDPLFQSLEKRYDRMVELSAGLNEKGKALPELMQNALISACRRKDPPRDGGRWFLDSSIHLGELSLPKTAEEAGEMLWSILDEQGVIKAPKISIVERNYKKTMDEVKDQVEHYFKGAFNGHDDKDKKVEEARDSIFNIIDSSIGMIHKLEDKKTTAKFVAIIRKYYHDHEKHAPEGLTAFIELALEMIVDLVEKKDPPAWFEILAVTVMGVIQMVAGVIIKAFIPVVGELIGNALISTGIDDVMFAITSAVSGEFSWDAYASHKVESLKRSIISSAISCGISFGTTAIQSGMGEACRVQQLSGVEKLAEAGKITSVQSFNLGTHILKEVGRSFINMGISQVASRGLEGMAKLIGSSYEGDISKTIDEAVNRHWEGIVGQSRALYEKIGCDRSILANLSECMQLNLKEVEDGNGLDAAVRTSKQLLPHAASIVGEGGWGTLLNWAGDIAQLGVSIPKLIDLVEESAKNFGRRIRETKNRKALPSDPQEISWDGKDGVETHLNDLKKQYKEKMKALFQAILHGAVYAPLIAKGTEALVKAGSKIIPLTEQEALAQSPQDLANIGEAENNPEGAFYDKALRLWRKADQEVKPEDLVPEETPVNSSASIALLETEYGSSVKFYKNADGQLYVQRPTRIEYAQAVRDEGKMAGDPEMRALANLTHRTLVIRDPAGKEIKRFEGGGNELDLKMDTLPSGVGHITFTGGPGREPGPGQNDCLYQAILDSGSLPGQTIEGLRGETADILTNNADCKRFYHEWSLDSAPKAFVGVRSWEAMQNASRFADGVPGLLDQMQQGFDLEELSCKSWNPDPRPELGREPEPWDPMKEATQFAGGLDQLLQGIKGGYDAATPTLSAFTDLGKQMMRERGHTFFTDEYELLVRTTYKELKKGLPGLNARDYKDLRKLVRQSEMVQKWFGKRSADTIGAVVSQYTKPIEHMITVYDLGKCVVDPDPEACFRKVITDKGEDFVANRIRDGVTLGAVAVARVGGVRGTAAVITVAAAYEFFRPTQISSEPKFELDSTWRNELRSQGSLWEPAVPTPLPPMSPWWKEIKMRPTGPAWEPYNPYQWKAR